MTPVKERTPPSKPSCCAASRGDGRELQAGDGRARSVPTGLPGPLRGPSDPEDMVSVPPGIFRMGTDLPGFPADGEAPSRRVRLRGFRIDRYAVTNRRFAAFVEATGHRTEAEAFGWSFVFASFLPAEAEPTRGAPGAPWWRQVFGAWWAEPEGPGSTLVGREEHPVVHVSWNDAVAFAAWEGKRLPSEAEWEYAARGGRDGTVFPWGDELEPGGRHRCNVWQGDFPHVDRADDGHAGTAPVDAFEPNGYGLLDPIGNTWEWCADWFGTAHGGGAVDDPRGPATGPGRVMKGGSYLCHASYCNRYRLAARTHNTPDSSTGNIGIRLVRDA